MMRKRFVAYFICIVTATLFSSHAGAVWEEDGTLINPGKDGNPVMDLRMVSDGICGATIGWHFGDYGHNNVQRINWNCELQYLPDPASQHNDFGIGLPQIASDNAGGVFITGSGAYPPSTYFFECSHVGPAGDVIDVDLFTEVFEGWRVYPMLISDDSGGIVLVWREIYMIGDNTIKIQRVDSGNNTLWADNGLVVCASPGARYDPVLAPDGTGGAIVAWADTRADRAIYAQRIYFSGMTLWTENGVAVCSAAGYEKNYSIISDGSNGAIIVWQDDRSGSDRIYAQRLDSNGTPRWTTDGLEICTAPGVKDYPCAVTDGKGGAIILWRDSRSGDLDVYAQRISAGGTLLWGSDGQALAAGPGDQRCNRAISDNLGGAIVSWVNDTDSGCDIFAQHVDSLCNELWGPGYVPVCTAEGDQDAITMVNNCTGGAILSWIDYRNWQWGEIRAAQVVTSTTGDPEIIPLKRFSLEQNYPNPFNPHTVISFELIESSVVSLNVFDPAGRLVRNLFDRLCGAGHYDELWDGKDQQGKPVSSGVYFYQLTAGSSSDTRKMILIR